MNSETGKWLVIIGGFLVLIGLVLCFFANKLQWLGRLPGDIRIERESFKLYIPLTTMLLASIVLSLVLWLIRRLAD